MVFIVSNSFFSVRLSFHWISFGTFLPFFLFLPFLLIIPFLSFISPFLILSLQFILFLSLPFFYLSFTIPFLSFPFKSYLALYCLYFSFFSSPKLHPQLCILIITSLNKFTQFIFVFRYANLILNLFALMVDANVPDIALEPDKTVKKVTSYQTTSSLKCDKILCFQQYVHFLQ